MRQIGQLFLLRMNINLVGNVLDSPVSYAPVCALFVSKLTSPVIFQRALASTFFRLYIARSSPPFRLATCSNPNLRICSG